MLIRSSLKTAGRVRGGRKVHRCKGFTGSPARVRSTCVGPGVVVLEREAQGRLGETAGNEDRRIQPWVAKQSLIGMRQAFGSDRGIVLSSKLKSRKVILYGDRGRILPGIGPDDDFIQHFQLGQIACPPAIIAV